MNSTRGHRKFRRHLQNMRLAEESKCKFFDEDETAEHVMCKCEAYAKIRHKENQNVNLVFADKIKQTNATLVYLF